MIVADLADEDAKECARRANALYLSLSIRSHWRGLRERTDLMVGERGAAWDCSTCESHITEELLLWIKSVSSRGVDVRFTVASCGCGYLSAAVALSGVVH